MDFREYFASVKRYPKLSNAKVLQIFAQKNRQDACHEIVVRNLQLVCKLALDWQSIAKEYGVDLMDLAASGSIGLFLATRRYNPKKNTNLFHFF